MEYVVRPFLFPIWLYDSFLCDFKLFIYCKCDPCSEIFINAMPLFLRCCDLNFHVSDFPEIYQHILNSNTYIS